MAAGPTAGAHWGVGRTEAGATGRRPFTLGSRTTPGHRRSAKRGRRSGSIGAAGESRSLAGTVPWCALHPRVAAQHPHPRAHHPGDDRHADSAVSAKSGETRQRQGRAFRAAGRTGSVPADATSPAHSGRHCGRCRCESYRRIRNRDPSGIRRQPRTATPRLRARRSRSVTGVGRTGTTTANSARRLDRAPGLLPRCRSARGGGRHGGMAR